MKNSILLLKTGLLIFLFACEKYDKAPDIPSGLKTNYKTLADFDGNEYTAVLIDNLWWTTQNLKTTHYSDGKPLFNGTDVNGLNYYYYQNNIENASKYGLLYTWDAATNSQYTTTLVQGICPEGWRLPTQNDWLSLIRFLGGELYAGGRLKTIETEFWNAPNLNANDASGFSAIGSGYIMLYPGGNNISYNQGKIGYLWSSTFIPPDNNTGIENLRVAYALYYNGQGIYKKELDKYASTACVRCIQDAPKITENSEIEDAQGNSYKTVKLGEQWWMAENLKTKTGSGSFAYNNSDSLENIYGRLYNWETAKNACPSGWHLPSDEDWEQLEVNLGMSKEVANWAGLRGTNEGNLLKADYGWQEGGNGTNSSGFTALPGGYYYLSNGTVFFTEMGSCYMWTSTKYELIEGQAVTRWLGPLSGQIGKNNTELTSGLSVRCVKD